MLPISMGRYNSEIVSIPLRYLTVACALTMSYSTLKNVELYEVIFSFRILFLSLYFFFSFNSIHNILAKEWKRMCFFFFGMVLKRKMLLFTHFVTKVNEKKIWSLKRSVRTRANLELYIECEKK